MSRARPRNVLFLHSGRDWLRGSERVLLDLVSNLPADRFRPVVWCDADALRRASRDLEVDCLSAPLPRADPSPWWRGHREAIDRATAVFREVRPDLLHVNALECLPWALRAARKHRIPIVVHLHLPTTLEERVWSGLHQTSMVVGVSRSSLDWVRPDGLPASSTRLIYNGVVPARLERGDGTGLRAELGIPPEALVVVIVGSLIPLKAVSVVIDALSRLPSSFHLVIVGGGEEQSRLEAQSFENRVASRVHFLGDREDAGSILRDAADILVSAATSEALGLNVIEAGYFGLPVAVTDIPSHREIVDPGRTGLLFPMNDVSALAGLLLRLQEPKLRHRLGQAASEEVRRRFTAERMFAEFVGLYDELLARPGWRHGWLGASRLPACYVKFGLNRIFRSSAVRGNISRP